MTIQNDFPFDINFIIKSTFYKDSSIQKITQKAVQIEPQFAIKVSGKWHFNKKSLAVFTLIYFNTSEKDKMMALCKALNKVYDVPINFSLAILQEELQH